MTQDLYSLKEEWILKTELGIIDIHGPEVVKVKIKVTRTERSSALKEINKVCNINITGDRKSMFNIPFSGAL